MILPNEFSQTAGGVCELLRERGQLLRDKQHYRMSGLGPCVPRQASELPDLHPEDAKAQTSDRRCGVPATQALAKRRRRELQSFRASPRRRELQSLQSFTLEAPKTRVAELQSFTPKTRAPELAELHSDDAKFRRRELQSFTPKTRSSEDASFRACRPSPRKCEAPKAQTSDRRCGVPTTQTLDKRRRRELQSFRASPRRRELQSFQSFTLATRSSEDGSFKASP
eukprot:s1398_g10.t1